jgi:hypothetical protein
MDTDSRQQATVSGYATGPMTKVPNWHKLVVLDVLFNNLTTGLFLIAAFGELALPEDFTTVATAAYPIALVLLFADLLCLVVDLGDPLRFHHMLRVFKPSSPMSLGTWCLTVYALLLTALVAINLLPGGGMALEWSRRLAVIAGLLPALGAAAYKGVLFSTSSQPGWKDARWLGGYLINSAFLLGCAELLALSVLMGQERAVTLLRPALVLLLLLNMVPLGLLLADVRAMLWERSRNKRLVGYVVSALVVGILLPLCLLPVAASTLTQLGSVLFILLGNLILRFVIVELPHAAVD